MKNKNAGSYHLIAEQGAFIFGECQLFYSCFKSSVPHCVCFFSIQLVFCLTVVNLAEEHRLALVQKGSKLKLLLHH